MSESLSLIHLNGAEVGLSETDNAPVEKLLAYRERLGWTFAPLSSHRTEFTVDFKDSFIEAEPLPKTPNYGLAETS